MQKFIHITDGQMNTIRCIHICYGCKVSEKLHQCEKQLIQQRKMTPQISDPGLLNGITAIESDWNTLLKGKVVC
jgi:hypothetical protein